MRRVEWVIFKREKLIAAIYAVCDRDGRKRVVELSGEPK